MFESVRQDPGEQGQMRAGRIFYVLAAFNLIGALFAFVQYHSLLAKLIASGMSVILAVLSYVTAKGIDEGKRWALWLGIAQAVLSLFNPPVGTIVGIAALVYLRRASKAGLLRG